MTKKTVKLLVVMSAVMLVALFLPVVAAEEAVAEQDDAIECVAPEAADVSSQSVKPRPGPSCLSSQPLSCASLPVPQGGSCSCTAALEQKKCKSCESGERGQVLRTTCTIVPACYSPPCDIQQNIVRSAISCTG